MLRDFAWRKVGRQTSAALYVAKRTRAVAFSRLSSDFASHIKECLIAAL
jgi:hypothetical protein